MRWLVAQPGPAFSVADVYAGWVEALRAAGQQVFEFNLDDRLTFYGSVLIEAGNNRFRRALTGEQATELAVNGLYAAILKTRPHVLLVISAFFTPPELLHITRTAGVRVVVVHTESPYEDDRQLAIAPWADLNLINDPTNLDAFRADSAAEYFPQAYRPSVHHPGPADAAAACDLAFVGTGFPSRIAFLEQMNLDGLDVALAGNWKLLVDDSPLRKHLAHDLDDCCDNTETARLYRSAKVGLNLYRRDAEDSNAGKGWSCGPREIEMAACGLPFARDPRGEGDALFLMLPTFTGPQEAAELLRWWLAHPDARTEAARLARTAIADRTFDAHAARLLRLLERK